MTARGRVTVGIIQKPWGWEEILMETPNYRVKKLFVIIGHRTSEQYHKLKEETWIFPDGRVQHIAPGAVHRLANNGPHPVLEVLEVAHGDDSDIVRLQDDYGRSKPEGP
jgi:mannose-6-phosphate isomerase-like protein (cupin superfamily)